MRQAGIIVHWQRGAELDSRPAPEFQLSRAEFLRAAVLRFPATPERRGLQL